MRSNWSGHQTCDTPVLRPVGTEGVRSMMRQTAGSLRPASAWAVRGRLRSLGSCKLLAGLLGLLARLGRGRLGFLELRGERCKEVG